MASMRRHFEGKTHNAVSWPAVAVAVGLLVGGGIWYRVKAAGYAQYSTSLAIPVGTLAQLPTHFDEWEGKDVPLSDNIVRRTATDDHINRVYQRARDRLSVGLFVGYGVRLRDLTPHRPEVCYPGAGWVMLDREAVSVKAADGVSIDCQVFRFRRGGLSTQHVTVLDFYIVDGQYWPDVTGLREKAAQMAKDRNEHYVAQVQIVCGDSGVGDTGKTGVQEFAAAASPRIHRVIEDAVGKKLGKVMVTSGKP